MDKIHVEMKIPMQVFSKDFLDIEVKKRLAIRGDELIFRFKSEYYAGMKSNFKRLLSHDYIYIVKEVKDDLIIFDIVA